MQIDIENVSKSFGKVQALRDVNLTIPTGMFGLLGPNGAGKSTLMRILAGILRPGSGRVCIGGTSMKSMEAIREMQKTLGYLPQDLGLYPNLTAAEFLDYIALLKGMGSRPLRRERITHLLETVGLATDAGRKLKGFSGGMKRRVGIAQALLNDPQLLIVDEPTAGLDPEERVRFRRLLVGLAADRTVLLSTHIIEDVGQACPRLAVMAGGRIAFLGETGALLASTRERVWTLTADGEAIKDTATVVSASGAGAAAVYRVISADPPSHGAKLVEPTLEDAYLDLVHRTGEHSE